MSTLLIFLLLFCGASCRQFRKALNYSREKPPPCLQGMNKTYIQAAFNLRNILDLSESNQRISLEVSLILFWYDTRLTVNQSLLHGEDQRGRYLTLGKKDAEKLWTPDLYIDKVRQIRGPKKVFYFQEPITLRLYKDNRVRYSSRCIGVLSILYPHFLLPLQDEF